MIQRALGVTLGDPAGIGPELVAAAWTQRQALDLPPFALIGALPAWVGALPMRACTADDDISLLFKTFLPILGTGTECAAVLPGQPDRASATAALAAIELGVDLARQGRIAGLVTLPVAKANLKAIGFNHPGQTEFLAARCGIAEADTVMLLWSRELATVPLTIHVPLADVPRLLDAALIESRARVVHAALRRDFGLKEPRLVLAGLNPHAGEAGMIGREELDVMAPALAALRKAGIDVRGPVSADGLFHADARATYDVALCPTHDQALIPVKALAFDEAVNTTLGLPIIRTSPDHGTAFALAGKGQARIDSFVAALKLARAMADRRAAS